MNIWDPMNDHTATISDRVAVSRRQSLLHKAHAVPQGLCANLNNALKLLANQQEDGDGLLQNIVTNHGNESRRGLADGLREFIRVEMSAPLMMERYAEARERLKFRSLGCVCQGKSR